MKVTFWGVRGSVPAPGPRTLRYGGNTPCVAVDLPENNLVIFDCGTGARALGKALMQGAFAEGRGQATFALSMAHWDHIQGFPFFLPFYITGNQFQIVGFSEAAREVESALELQMAAQYFPVQSIKNMDADLELLGWEIHQPLRVGSASLHWVHSQRGPEGACAYRLESEGKSLVYVGHAGYPEAGASPQTQALCKDADLLIHECSFTPEDGNRYRYRGLASLKHATEAAINSGAKKLALFHYDQDYSDQQIDNLVRLAQENLDQRKACCEAIAAAEGSCIAL